MAPSFLPLLTFTLFCAIVPHQIKATETSEQVEVINQTEVRLKLIPHTSEVTEEALPIKPDALEHTQAVLKKRLQDNPALKGTLSIDNQEIVLTLPPQENKTLKPLVKKLIGQISITEHQVHRDSKKLGEEVAKLLNDYELKHGKKLSLRDEQGMLTPQFTKLINNLIPAAYTVYPHAIKDFKTGNLLRTDYVIVNIVPAITTEDIKTAHVSQDPTEVIIELTDEGGSKNIVFTKALEAGKDQICTVVNNKAFNVATLQAEVLGKRFVISGLSGKEESEAFIKALNHPLPHKLEIVSIRQIRLANPK